MITDTVAAWQVEEGDLITLGGEVAFTVVEYLDNGDGITMTLADDDGDLGGPFCFMPFDTISLVVSLDDPDEDMVV